MPVIKIVFLTIMLLTLFASTFLRTTFWGLNSWGFVSITVGIVLALLFAPLVSKRVSERFTDRTWSGKRPRTSRILITAAITLLLLWLFRTRHDLWGERHFISSVIDNGVVLRPVAPLSMFLHAMLFRLLNAVLLSTGAATTILLSILAGFCYLFVSILAARILHRGKDSEWTLSSAVLLSGGFVVVFFGAGGDAPLAVLFSLLFIYSAILFIRGTGSVMVPALLLLASIFSHLSTVYLIPPFLYLLVLGLRSKARRKESLAAIAFIAICWITVEIIFSMLIERPGPATHLTGLAATLFRGTAAINTQRLGNWLLNALNGLLIVGPAAFLAPVLLPLSRQGTAQPGPRGSSYREEEIFLWVITIPALLMVLVGAWRIDGGLRWNIIAPTGPALTMFTIVALRRILPLPSDFRRATVLLIVLGIFHTLPWILVNAIPEAAEQRLLTLPLAPGRSETIIGSRAFEIEDFEKAYDSFLLAAEKDSLNAVAYYHLGELVLKEDKYMNAITYFMKATELQPHSPQYRLGLAEAFIAKRWFEEAAEQLEMLTATYPDSTIYWKRLGYARNHGGMYEGAIEAYQKALELEPDEEQNLRSLVSAMLNRGAQHQEEGELEDARKLYLEVASLYPLDWVAFNNLATLEMVMENYEKAYEILEQALMYHPFISNLNFNMGLVLEQLGKNKEALEYLRRSADLDPLSSNAGEHIKRLQEKLQKQNGG